jgi:flagellar L-ring protein precursor FlgH
MIAALIALLGTSPLSAVNLLRKTKPDPQQLRADYVHRLQMQPATSLEIHTAGSLWVASGGLTELASDYKAHNLNDILTVLVAVRTSATQTGNLTSQRTFQTQSAITGLPGGIPTHGVNPLLNAQSATNLKGQGQTAADSVLTTSLTAQVIAVLGNGNLVVEAQRKVFMNNQHEDVVVRGVVRIADIAPDNTVSSAALGNLEVEIKGKGIVSDSTRPPNRLTRAVLWLFGF